MPRVALRLRARNLAVERGGRIVLSGLDFEVAAGELLVVVGPNGSGKTSLLRTIAGLSDIHSGTIELWGGKAERKIGEQAHYVGHHDASKPALTVAENLQFWANFLGAGEVGRGVGAFGLETLSTLPAAVLSAGQRRRLALSRLLLVSRSIWLLDEPLSGLDSSSSARLRTHMAGHLEAGGIIVAATHADLGMVAGQRLDLGEP
jgi:heme exporter protein A